MAIVLAMANTEEKSPREKASDAFRAMLAFLEFLVTNKVPPAVDTVTVVGLNAAYSTNQEGWRQSRHVYGLQDLVKEGEAGLTVPDPSALAVEVLAGVCDSVENDKSLRVTVGQLTRLSFGLARMLKAGAVFTDDAVTMLAEGEPADVDAMFRSYAGFTETNLVLEEIFKVYLSDTEAGGADAQVNRDRWIAAEHERLTAMHEGAVYP